MPDTTLGRTAYKAEALWLAEIMPGGRGPSWDDLDPEHREVYQRIAAPVAAAERERMARHMEALAAASGGLSRFAYQNAAREIRTGAGRD
jgi:hypothetical protein